MFISWKREFNMLVYQLETQWPNLDQKYKKATRSQDNKAWNQVYVCVGMLTHSVG